MQSGKIAAGTFDVFVVSYQFDLEHASKPCHEFRRKFPSGRIVAIEHPSGSAPTCKPDALVSAFDSRALVRAG